MSRPCGSLPWQRLTMVAGNAARSAASAAGLTGVNAVRYIMSSTRRNTAVDRPLTSRLDRSAMASNTGCTSIGRTGDHLEDVGRRGLPLQRLPGLVEQPRVLDGDHGLVGEGLQQLDVMVGRTARVVSRVALIMPIRASRSSAVRTSMLRKPPVAPFAAARATVTASVSVTSRIIARAASRCGADCRTMRPGNEAFNVAVSYRVRWRERCQMIRCRRR